MLSPFNFLMFCLWSVVWKKHLWLVFQHYQIDSQSSNALDLHHNFTNAFKSFSRKEGWQDNCFFSTYFLTRLYILHSGLILFFMHSAVCVNEACNFFCLSTQTFSPLYWVFVLWSLYILNVIYVWKKANVINVRTNPCVSEKCAYEKVG